MAFFDAMSAVEKEDVEVPNHLKDNNRDAEGFGHGRGYLYPHAYRDHWVAQQYLPDALMGRVFYTPTEQGYEGKIRDDVLSRREAQIAAILEDADGTECLAVNPVSDWWAKAGHFAGFEKAEENLTFTPEDRSKDDSLSKAENAWKARTELNRAETLLETRNAMIASAEILRHHRCLAVNADDGLLVFDLIRKTPEGHVYGICRTEKGMDTLKQYSSTLAELDQPEYTVQSAGNLWADGNLENAIGNFGDIEIDRFFARNIFATKNDMDNAAGTFTALKEKGMLADNFRIILSQIIPCGGQHLSRLLKNNSSKCIEEIAKAEKEFFANAENNLFNWDETTIEETFSTKGFECKCIPFVQTEKRRITEADCSKWFDEENSAYGRFISEKAGRENFNSFKELFLQEAQKSTFDWKVKNCIIIIG